MVIYLFTYLKKEKPSKEAPNIFALTSHWLGHLATCSCKVMSQGTGELGINSVC